MGECLKELGKKGKNMDMDNFKLMDKLSRDIGIMDSLKELTNEIEYNNTFLYILLFRIFINFRTMLSTLKLASKTPLGKEEFKKAKTILQSLYDNHESFDFRLPVDWKGNCEVMLGMGLLDYAFLIKHPMDLGTIDTKLKEDRYETVEEILDDIQLVWDNCKTYNPPNTVIIS